ncbi:hypothetical protein J8273_6087 [Carpediemonas membranifera]|uniref:Ubiquitin-like domain-containing protein n=1 Tax=Carpediemonas membranifera TaxID=201153 RepID=A0A8J6DYQ7_9EUKA|nr:hypothetical protein J8273_6087 [Carpediemonas membranifera]|eukprot:KAG9392619.1 hypothetical protein J8273_6087 [Carpediemonas membranifera]
MRVADASPSVDCGQSDDEIPRTSRQDCMVRISVRVDDRMQQNKTFVQVDDEDTILVMKKAVATKIGTRAEKIRLQKAGEILQNHLTLQDYEIHDKTNVELYYQ